MLPLLCDVAAVAAATPHLARFSAAGYSSRCAAIAFSSGLPYCCCIFMLLLFGSGGWSFFHMAMKSLCGLFSLQNAGLLLLAFGLFLLLFGPLFGRFLFLDLFCGPLLVLYFFDSPYTLAPLVTAL